MGATNRTTNYNLPQFVGSDKPTWLGDFNGAMSSIDTQMKANNDLGTLAKTTADTAVENANTAIANAETAQNTANTANETANSALTKANQNEAGISKFNLINFDNYSPQDISIDYGTIESGSIRISSNSDGSVAKIYGQINLRGDGTHQIRKLNIANTRLRPTSEITIFPAGSYSNENSNTLEGISVKISTNGTVEVTVYGNANGFGVALLYPCLLSMKNFGDVAPQ